jgi:tRNA(Ile)-lysidine synthase
MEIAVPAGKYVVAVSGGVDSAVLLHLLVQLSQQPNANLRLVVAHFDHGIRIDSAEDRKLVQRLAHSYKLPFVYDQAALGPKASEAVARDARYSFLRTVSKTVGADAIITAHHQDDLLETVIINLLRGTKSRGLSSLRSTEKLRRPLLDYSKKTIRSYAAQHKLEWHEDSTNEDEAYLRNYVRKQIMPRLDESARAQLLEHSKKAASLNDAIHAIIEEYLAKQPEPQQLNRADFRSLPPEVSHEVLASWLRAQTDVGITSKLIERLANAIGQGRNGSRIDVAHGYSLELTRSEAHLVVPIR